MNVHEVPEPILNSPFKEPRDHWRITEHEPPQRVPGRRPAMYFYRPPGHESSSEQQEWERPSDSSWSTGSVASLPNGGRWRCAARVA